MRGVKLVNVSNGNKVQTRIEMFYSLQMQALMIGRIATSNSFLLEPLAVLPRLRRLFNMADI